MKLLPLKDIFNIEYGNKFDLNKMSIASSGNRGVAFVSRSSKNSGVVKRVLPYMDKKPYPAGLITVALGGSMLSSFVQQEPFYTGQNIKILEPKENMSIEKKYSIVLR